MVLSFLFLLFVLAVLYWIIYVFHGIKEPFQWNSTTVQEFDFFQNTYNPNLIFDLSMLQEQATQEEAEELLRTGFWPWERDVQNQFMEKIQNSTIIKTNPQDAMNHARKIYNNQIMKQMLEWSTPEGRQTLTGKYIEPGNYAEKSGLL